MSPKTPIIIVGAGGLGREVAGGIRRHKLPYEILGHIDDEKQGAHILSSITGHVPNASAKYITCFGDGTARRRVRMQLQARGASFGSIISPTSQSITPTDDLVNCLILGSCCLSNDNDIGADVLVQTFAVTGHDVALGDGVTLGAHSFVGGNAVLGACVTVHPHAVVLPKIRVGEGAVIGAGSVVIKNVAPYTTVFGAPARVIAYGKADA